MARGQRRGQFPASALGRALGTCVVVVFTAGLAVLPAAGAPSTTVAQAAPAGPAVPGEVIVGFREPLASATKSAVVSGAGGTPVRSFPQINAMLVRTAADRAGAVASALGSDERIRYVEPNYVVSAAETPNDPSFSELWGLHNTGQTGGTPDADIDAPEAWDLRTGSSKVVVGITDTGVDFSHPELAEQQWVNTGENCGSVDPTIACAQRTNGLDDDGNTYVDDWRGWDFVSNDNNPFDDNDHGTHVAGTIGAVGDNGVGVTGVSWNVKIAALKFLSAAGSGSTAGAISATLYSASEGIDVSNNSWGGGSFSQALVDAIEYGASQGMLYVAAAGNFSSNNDSTTPFYPASYGADVVVAVAATDHDDDLSSFSNYGATSVDLAAPGTAIYSTIPGNSYAFYDGTSMATPHVAGAAALLRAQFPVATPYGLKALLMRTVDPKTSLSGITVTGGRLNVRNAVACAGAPEAVLLAPLPSFSVDAGHSLPIRVLGANCASPAGLANVSVTVNGTPIALTASNPDTGRYTGSFTPTSGGPLTVTATVTAGGDSDVQTVSGTANGSGGGGSGGYACQDVSDAWVDVTGGTQLPLAVDDGFASVILPFAFTYYGQSHTQAYVSTNGFLAFGSSASASLAQNPPIPSTAPPHGVIAPFWDDLNPAVGGALYTRVTGSAPNRAFHVEWFDVPHFTNVGAATLEVSLYETTNEIRFRYLDTDFGSPTFNAGRSATAGVENHAGTAGTQYSRNAAVLTEGKAISCSEGAPSSPPALTVTTTTLPGGTVGQAYSQPVTATGGTTPYGWSVVSGSLPPGLGLSPSGTPSATISGTPTTEGTYDFTVQVTDAASATDTQALSIVVGPASPPSGGPAFGSAGAPAAALGTSIDVPYPAGTSANDLLLLLVVTRDTADVSTPEGFTEGGARTQNAGLRAEWFWKRATGAESGTLNVTKESGLALLMGRMYRYTGVVTSGTPHEAAAQDGKGANATITPVDIATAGPDRRVVVLVAEGDDLALGDFAGGTATVGEEVAEATTSLGTDGALGINGLGRASPEEFDFGTYTLPAGSAHIEFSLALRPA